MVEVKVSGVIERPPPDVFRIIATEHVENHPRWDPNMSLEQVTPGPIGVGTVIRRSYMRGDQRVEGDMEVTEFETDHAMGVVIRDGLAEFSSRVTMEPTGDQSTLLTIQLEADVPVERMDEGPIRTSLERMKALIEAEA